MEPQCAKMPTSPSISPSNRDSQRFFPPSEEARSALSTPAGSTAPSSPTSAASVAVEAMKRHEFESLDNEDLKRDIAFWLSAAGDKYVSERNFEADLADGVALCTIMTKLHGSSLSSFHKVAPVGSPKAHENMVAFRRACDRLNLPVGFSFEELLQPNHPDVCCALIFLAHLCYCQGVATEAMNESLMSKIDEINDIIDESFEPMQIESTAQSIEESLADMKRSMSANAQAMLQAMQEAQEESAEDSNPWFESVAKYMLSIKEFREVLKRSRQENVCHLIEKTVSLKNAIAPGIRARIEVLSVSLLKRADSLPDVIKSRLPLETVRRLT